MSGDHLDAWCWDEPGYVESKLAVVEKYNLKIRAISNHHKSQAVCDDPIDSRHEGIVSSKVWSDGNPDGVRPPAPPAGCSAYLRYPTFRPGGRLARHAPRTTRY